MTCEKHEECINIIEVLDYDTKTDGCYLKHRIYDKNGEQMIRENLLLCDTIVAIQPYQTD